MDSSVNRDSGPADVAQPELPDANEKKPRKDMVKSGSQGWSLRSEDVDTIPNIVWLMVAVEFCERYSFFGMRTVLTQYLIFLGMSDHGATSAYHMFIVLSYFISLPGAIVSDSWWGRFKTITIMATVYAIGETILAGSSFSASFEMSIVALVVISIGSGGIKPCVSAFGADQLHDRQSHLLQRFFAFFYLSANVGSMLSTFMTPILRNTSCAGSATCYPLAFGVPAIAMWLAILIFITGWTSYRRRPVTGNVLMKACKAVWHALRAPKKVDKEHWLHHADDLYDKKFLNEIRAVFQILVLYLPLPFFWALYDQQGSRWLIQALKMDNRVFGYEIIEEQIQLFNPIAIVCLIPFFTYWIYPFTEKLACCKRSHHKIIWGGLFAASSFFMSAALDHIIESQAKAPTADSYVSIVNMGRCPLALNNTIILKPLSTHTSFYTGSTNSTVVFNVQYLNCSDVPNANEIATIHLNFTLGQVSVVVVQAFKGRIVTGPTQHSFATNSSTSLLLPLFLFGNNSSANVNVKAASLGRTYMFPLKPLNSKVSLMYGDPQEIVHTEYKMSVFQDNTQLLSCGKVVTKIHRFYVLAISHDAKEGCQFDTIIHPKINMMFQLLQILIMTIGEILFSVTGAEMTYSQAPPSMKSFVQSFWTLTIAFGNLLVVVIESANFFENEALSYVFFGSLMVIDMAVFAWIANSFVYLEDLKKRSEEEQPNYKAQTDTTAL